MCSTTFQSNVGKLCVALDENTNTWSLFYFTLDAVFHLPSYLEATFPFGFDELCMLSVLMPKCSSSLEMRTAEDELRRSCTNTARGR